MDNLHLLAQLDEYSKYEPVPMEDYPGRVEGKKILTIEWIELVKILAQYDILLRKKKDEKE